MEAGVPGVLTASGQHQFIGIVIILKSAVNPKSDQDLVRNTFYNIQLLFRDYVERISARYCLQ
jgi:hypothetical protein